MSDVMFMYIIYKTCVYMYTIPSFAQYGFVLEAYKLNSTLALLCTEARPRAEAITVPILPTALRQAALQHNH